MLKIKLIFFLLFFILCLSCSKNIVEEDLIKEKDIELQMIEAYSEGLKELKNSLQPHVRGLQVCGLNWTRVPTGN